MSKSPTTALEDFVFLNGRGYAHFASTPGLPLSLKTVFNGSVRYRFDHREVTIDDGGYLILNNRQPYTIEIASPTMLETFILWFPDGWAEEVCNSLTKSNDALLADIEQNAPAGGFFEKYTPHDSSVSPRVAELRAVYQQPEPMDAVWLEERLRALLAAMFKTQLHVQRSIAKLPAARAATRAELWKRINRARDFLHSRYNATISLETAGRIACLSPFHFLRTFQAAFGLTPHEYLTNCRVERAKFLLRRTDLPLTEIAFDSGFATPSAFSSAFRKATGVAPRSWRGKRPMPEVENSKIRKVFLTSRH